jgi:hypothetical protein
MNSSKYFVRGIYEANFFDTHFCIGGTFLGGGATPA